MKNSLLIAFVSLSLCACGSGSNSDTNTAPPTNTAPDISLTLVGKASLAGQPVQGADVTVTLNQQVIQSSTDANGSYQVPMNFPSKDADFTYTVTVDDGAGTTLRRVELLNELLSQPDSDSAPVTADVNEITTAEYEYLYTLLGQQPARLNAPYSNSIGFTRYYKNINPDTLLESAAVIQYATLHGELNLIAAGLKPIQEYQLALLQDPTAASEFEAILFSLKNPDPAGVQSNPGSNQKAGSPAGKATTTPYLSKAFVPGETYYTFLGSTPGTVRLGAFLNLRLTLHADDTATVTFETGEESGLPYTLEGNHLNIDWRAAGTGGTVPSEFVTQPNWGPFEYSFDYRTVYHDCESVTPHTIAVRLINSRELGVRQADIRYSTEFQNCWSYDAETGVPNAEPSSFITVTHEAMAVLYGSDDLVPLVESDIAGARIIMDHQSPEVFLGVTNDAGTFGYQQDRAAHTYSFDPSGNAGTLSGPVHSATPFNWSVDVAGLLHLDFGNYVITWAKLMDDQYEGIADSGGGSAVSAVYTDGQGARVVTAMAVADELAAPVVVSDLVGTWEHGFSVSDPNYEVYENKIYWVFRDNGTVDMVFHNLDGIETNRREYLWEPFGEEIRLYQTIYIAPDGSVYAYTGYRSASNPARYTPPCKPTEDPDCYYYHQRTWKVIAKRGGRLYIKEDFLGFADPYLDQPGGNTAFNPYWGIIYRTNLMQPLPPERTPPSDRAPYAIN